MTGNTPSAPLLNRLAALSPEQRELLMRQYAQRRAAAGGGPARPARAEAQPIPRRTGDRGSAPLSTAQQRFWFLAQMDPTGYAYNMAVGVRIGGPLDAGTMTRAVAAIIDRQEALRTAVGLVDGQPVQRILPVPADPLPRLDLSGHPTPEDELTRIGLEERERPFALSDQPLARFLLVRLADDAHVLFFTMHHIVADGWSFGVFLRELQTVYAALADGRPSPLAEPAIQYADYAVWQREQQKTPDYARQAAHWTRRLAGASGEVDLSTPAAPGRAGGIDVGHRPIHLDADTCARLRALSGAVPGSTLFITLISTLKALLARFSGQEDLLVGSAVANRNRTEIEGLIGEFADIMVLRTDLSGDPSFRDLLKRVRDELLDAQANSALTLAEIIEALDPDRIAAPRPLVRVVFSFLNVPHPEESVGGLSYSLLEIEGREIDFDLYMTFHEEGAGIRGHLSYDRARVDPAMAEALADAFEHVLSVVTADPDRRLWSLPLPAAPLAVAGADIRAQDGSALPVGAVGRLYEGGHPTPDLARHRPGGGVEIVGSVDGSVLRNGVRLYPAAIEDTLRALPDIADLAILTRRTADGPALVACVVPAGPFLPDRLADSARAAGLSDDALPDAWVAVARIPLLPDGVIDRATLAEVPVLGPAELERAETLANRSPAAALLRPVQPAAPLLHAGDLVPPRAAPAPAARTAAPAAPALSAAPAAPVDDPPALSDGGPLAIPADAPATLVEALRHIAATRGDCGIHVIGASGEDFLSYAALLDAAARRLTGLRGEGLKAGNRAILQFDDLGQHFITFWACLLGGIVPVTVAVPPTYTDGNGVVGKLHGTWSHLGGPPVLTTAALAPRVGGLETLLAMAGLRVIAADRLDPAATPAPIHPARPEDVAFLQLTSGSTGVPKAIQITHRGVIHHVHGTAAANGLGAGDVSLNWLPLDHVVPLLTCHVKDTCLGRRQIAVATDRVLAQPLVWLDLIERFRVTHTWAPNFAYKLVSTALDGAPGRHWDLSCIRWFVNAGEQVTTPVVQEFLERTRPFGVPPRGVRNEFGMAELCTVMTHGAGFDPVDSVHVVEKSSLRGRLRKATAAGPDTASFVDAGSPVPGVRIRIADAAGDTVREGVIGRLQVQGAVVTPGYLDNPEANAAAFADAGWFNTGDLGFILNGRLTLTGREKETIIVRGANFYCYEVEDVVNAQPGVEPTFAACCAVERTETGTEGLAVFYVPSDPGAPRKPVHDGIASAVAGALGLHPSVIVPLERAAFPKTTSGKIQRSWLREQLEGGAFDATLKAIDLETANANTVPSWFAARIWRPRRAAPPRIVAGAWLVFADDAGFAARLTLPADAILVERGDGFARLDERRFRADPTRVEDVAALFTALDGIAIGRALHLSGCAVGPDDDPGLLLGVFHLARALDARGGGTALTVATTRAQSTGTAATDSQAADSQTPGSRPPDSRMVDPWRAALAGMMPVLAQEMPALNAVHIDLPGNDPAAEAAWLDGEIVAAPRDPVVALRGGARLVPALEFRKPAPRADGVRLMPGGVYLLTGGLGGIGGELARHLLTRFGARLLLIGRRPADALDTEAAETLARLGALPGDVRYAACDVTDAERLEALTAEAEREWGAPLAGVFHLAGTYRECLLRDETAEALTAVLHAKTVGTMRLYALVERRPGAVFVGYSSVVATLGGATAGAYAAASRFLDAWCESHPHAFAPAWTMWDGLGMARSVSSGDALGRSRGYGSIDPVAGFLSLEAVLAAGTALAVIGLDSGHPFVRRHLAAGPLVRQELALCTETAADAVTLADRFGTPVPVRPVVLPALPRDAAGAVDRHALDALLQRGGAIADSAAPRTASERAVAEVWRDLLGSGRIGIHDNFFALGGHSLLATQLVARLAQRFGVSLPVATVFDHPELADFAAALDTLLGSGLDAASADTGTPAAAAVPALRPMPRAGDPPPSFAQDRLWFIDQLAPGQSAYVIPMAMRLTGRLDQEALARAIAEIVRRHETLRTAFVQSDGKTVQRIMPAGPWDLPVEDLRALDPAEREDAALRIAREETARPFDLAHAPMLRTRLLRLAADDHVLIAAMHHIASDGWSLGVLVRELTALYAAFTEGRPSPLPDLAVQYADFARWQHSWLSGARLDAELDWWRWRLDGAPMLELPTDRPRPAIQSYRGGVVTHRLPAALGDGLGALARSRGASLFMTMLAAFQALLGRLSGQDDIVVGSPIANREERATEDMIGFFVNSLVLRTRLDGDPTFLDLLDRVRATTLDAYAHQSLPFEVLVDALAPERSLGQNPLFQVMFVVQNAPSGRLELPGLTLTPLERQVATTRFDLEIHVWETDEGLEIVAYHSTDLFDAATVEQLVAAYRALLEGAVATPQARLSDLPVLTGGQRALVLSDWALAPEPAAHDRDGQDGDSPAATLHALTARAAARDPDAPALIGDGAVWSYATLDARANRLARRLLEEGVGVEDRVGVCLERGPSFILALLAVLKAGAAYVPLDPAYPRDRLDYLATDAGLRALISDGSVANRPVCACTLLLGGLADALDHGPADAPPVTVHPDNLANVIYTSGSTGRPKGVAVTHRGLVNLCRWHQRAYAVDGKARATQVAGLSFDAAGWEIWPYLTAGAAIAPVPQGTVTDPDALAAFLAAHAITHAFVPTPLVPALLAVRWPENTALRVMLAGGERLAEGPPPGLPFALLNHYGPTESSVVATAGPVPPRGGPNEPTQAEPAPSIGRPIDGFVAYVLDAALRPVPPGMPGELFVGGAGVARGYLGRAGMTAERFLPDPVSGKAGARLYRTGDRVRWRADGTLDFLGRRDHQVKLRGHRVELGEIEAALQAHPAVRGAVVLPPDQGRLSAFVVADGQDGSLRDTLSALADEREDEWQALYAETYTEPPPGDPLFHITGWTSSYTREDIPAMEMAAWRDGTVARIAAIGARSIWEIGCGTGLLLWKLARGVARYHATDFSAQAIAYLRPLAARDGLSHVTLERRVADDRSGLEGQRFDAVVINSVIQYFPSLAYLEQVLTGAAESAPGGVLFVGDVRSWPLQTAFQSSIQLHHAPADRPAAEIRVRVRDLLRAEKELLVSPAYFHDLAARLPGGAFADVQLRRARDRNEMTRFRFDATLYLGPPGAPVEPALSLVWSDLAQGLARGLADLEGRLAAGVTVELLDIPNARVAADQHAARTLDGSAVPALTAGELMAEADSATRGAVDPADLWDMGERLGYRVRVTAASDDPARIHALFEPSGSGQDGDGVGTPGLRPRPWHPDTAAPATAPAMDRAALANDPLRSRMEQALGTALRAHLRGLLPDHMVPADIVALDSLPLTPNGKIDRAALARSRDARPSSGSGGTAGGMPRTAAESTLAAIWRDLLGLESVGINDNFFELGGDSILSIQVVNRARAAGLSLAVRDLFEHQTVAALARAATPLGATEAGNEGPATGSAPLTPIQRWFLSQDFADAHHFNQTVLLTLRLAVDDADLHAALAALVERHDALRLRVTAGPEGWRQEHGDTAGAWAYERIDLSGLPAEERGAALESAAAAAQGSLSLTGPMVRAVRFAMGQTADGSGDRLLLIAHHLVVDAVSWRVLFDDLALALTRRASGQPLVPAPKTAAFQRWGKALESLAAAGLPEAERTHWTALAALAARPLPADHPDADDRAGSARRVTRGLDAGATLALQQRAGRAYRTDVADLLLTALAQTLEGWTGAPEILVDCEGHGRQDPPDGLDLTRTVGWFTALYPVALGTGGARDPGGAIKAVKERLRAVPRHGIGHGVLRFLTEPSPLAGVPGAGLAFNYLGQFDTLLTGDAPFAFATENAGPLQSPDARRAHALTVSAAVIDQRLQIEWTHGPRHAAETVEALADRHLAALEALIAHCLTDEAGGLTPSDAPLAALSQAALDSLPGGGRGIEALYPATPLQQGLLSHSLRDDGTGLYCEQFVFEIRGPADDVLLEEAWRGVARRHGILRSRLWWQGLDQPVLAIPRDVSLTLDRHDWRDLPDHAAAERRLDGFLADDRRIGLRPDLAPPLRLAWIALPGGGHWLVWSFHHVLLDGWSAFRVLEEVMELYGAGREGRPPRLDPAPAFEGFVRWRLGRDRDADAAFWRTALDGFTAPTPLPAEHRRRSAAATPSMATARIGLEGAATAALQAAARRCRVTLNTLAQAAWALLLHRYGAGPDVLFGATVSGRPAEVAGVERMVGLFINTVPVRVRVDGDARLSDWLKTIHARQAAAQPHEAASLAEIRGWSAVPHDLPLFDSIVAFENYPVAEALNRSAAPLDVVDSRYLGRTHYPMTLTVAPGTALELSLAYDAARFDGAAVERLLGHLAVLLRAMADGLDRPVGTLPILDAAERADLLARGRGVPLDAPFAAVQDRVAAHAARAPHAVAVTDGTDALTYAELEARAGRLAARLRALGVAPETLVALHLDRSATLLVGMLAVLKAGGAYVPVDPMYPAERIRYILEDSHAAVLVTDSALAAALGPVTAATLLVDGAEDGGKDGGGPAEESPFVSVPATAGQAAYVIYTSGSTGRPKGVVVTHGNLSRLLTQTHPWFGFGPGDVWTLFHSPAFDFSVWEIWGALCHGGRLVVVPHSTSRSPLMFRRLLSREGVTVLNQTPTAFRMLQNADAEEDGPLALRWVIFGGEALDPGQLRPWFERHGDEAPRLVNMYGITETTVHVTFHRVTAAEAAEPRGSLIGQPIPDLTLRVLDPAGQPAPVGVAGELYVGGGGLARGYLNRPALTAERYVTAPDGSGERLYRSGDLVRWLPDGELEHLGRADHQMKIRGFRIEPGEIEEALRRIPGIRQAFVAARADAGGEKALVAYVEAVPGRHRPDAAALRATLARDLPDYMIPSAHVWIDALPLTAHGKVDLAALPAPEGGPGDGDGSAPPNRRALRTEAERLLADIWAAVLGGRTFGPDDDFFAIGGHSLLVAQVMARIRCVFGVELEWRALFDAPTLGALAAHVETARAARACGGGVDAAAPPPVVPARRDGAPPLSFAQQRLWFLDRALPGPAYHIPLTLRLTGPLDVELLRRALAAVEARHEVLRTTLRLEDGGPVQIVAPAAGFARALPLTDLSGRPACEHAGHLHRTLDAEFARPFDLARDPAMRALLIRLDGQSHILSVVIHHVAADGWSMGVLTREIAAFYTAFADGREPALAPLALQYADYACWQRGWFDGSVLDRQIAFWRARLAGVPPLALPTSRPRPAVRRGRGGAVRFTVPPATVDSLRALGRTAGATLFMTLMAGWQVLLGRLSGQADFAVGIPVANRARAELEPLIGVFVNTLVLRADLSGDPDFRKVLTRVREAALDAYAHQDLPFERLVDALDHDRDPARTPLFQTMLTVQEAVAEPPELPGLTVAPVDVAITTAKFDLTLVLGDGPEGLSGLLEYDADLFDADAAAGIAQRFVRLLDAIAADPTAPVAGLPLLSAEERHRILTDWNDTARPYPRDGSLGALFVRRARAAPDALAVTGPAGSLTYGELLSRAARLANALRDRGAGPERRVGLVVERSPESVIATLAVALSGAAYVPLDPAYPPARLAAMIREAAVTLLVTADGTAPAWAPSGLPVLPLDGGAKGGAEDGPPEVAVPPTALAYVLFTSGTTGEPKAIGVDQRAVLRLVCGNDYAPLRDDDVVAHLSNNAFDAATFEIWGPLLNGALVTVLPQEVVVSPPDLAAALRHYGVTTAFLTTALFHRMAEAEPAAFAGLGHLLTGGQAVNPVQVRAVLDAGAPTNLRNVYGPTESTTFATSFPANGIGGDLTNLPIGLPIANTTLHVLGGRLEPVPPGVTGEIHLGGDGLARGYVNDARLTAARFIPDPFGPPGARLYATGDLARRLPDGTVEFQGRRDHQVKLRGHRIELGEIEAVAARHPGVGPVFAMLRQDDGDDPRLVLYLVGAAGVEEGLRAHLRAQLPRHALPSALVRLPGLPMTPTGKVDARALPAPGDGGSTAEVAAGAAIPAATAAETVLAGLWCDVLRVGSVGTRDNFFDLGGHSLLLVELQRRIAVAFGRELPIADLFRFPTVAALARHLSESEQAAPAGARLSVRESRQAARARRPARRGATAGNAPSADTPETTGD